MFVYFSAIDASCMFNCWECISTWSISPNEKLKCQWQIIFCWCCVSRTVNNVHFWPCFQGKKLMVIGTTSELGFLDSIGFCDTFSITYHVPTLNTNDAKKVNLFVLRVLACSWANYMLLTYALWMFPVVVDAFLFSW